ncbi:integrase [Streptomyces melanosporofaciens]|uniref:integrase n=1 Tax=Streptomyces melanosporofaciens TaxID=67327 RepID=UPI000A42D382|nr:integrase [Streptomyces melanosporofaciens]
MGISTDPRRTAQLGRKLGASTVWEILQTAGIDPTPQRTNQSWPVFLKAQASAIVATDLFHIDTVFLRRWFVLFFIDHGTRRMHMTGVTRHPTGPWITQQARNYLMDLGDRAESIGFLIRDRSAYFTGSFDAVFQAAGIRVIPTLPAVPRMNAIAERWIGSCRREGTDRVLITGERHLRLVVGEYAKHTTDTGRTDPSDSGHQTNSTAPRRPSPGTTLAFVDATD